MKVDKIEFLFRYGPNRTRGYIMQVKRYPSLLRFLRARLYHWYDMRIPIKIPGWHTFEKWLGEHGAQHCGGAWFPMNPGDKEPKARWRDRLFSWSINQDFRCFHLTEQQPEVLLDREVDANIYWKIRGKPKPKDYDYKYYIETYPQGGGPQ